MRIEKAKEIPLVLYLFDLLYADGEDLMNIPQTTRRKRLEKLFSPTKRIHMTEMIVSDQSAEQRQFFKRAVKAGHEGLMAKDPDAFYIPGRR